MVNKPPIAHPIPDDWKIFVSIASYRDDDTFATLKSLISKAAHPERLRVVVYNQQNYWNNQWDRPLDQKLNNYIEQVSNQTNAPSILVENIFYHNAKYVYDARNQI